MQKTKKTIAIIIAIALVFVMTPFSAFAANSDVTFTSNVETLMPGDEIVVTVSSSEIIGAAAVPMSISFEKDYFEVKSLAWNETIPNAAPTPVELANKNGFFNANYTDLMNMEELKIPNGTVFVNATLVVKEACTPGEHIIKLDQFEPANTAGDAINVTINQTELKIKVIGELPASQAITGLTAPAKNAQPVTTITAPANTSAKVEWYEGADTSKKFEGDKFAGGTVYTAKITVTPNENYVYGDSVTITLGDETITAKLENGNAVITKTFPATAEKTLTGISVSPETVDTQYRHGDTFNDDIVVVGTYDDGSNERLEAGSYTVSGLEKGDTSVNITAGNQTASVTLSKAVLGKAADDIITYSNQEVTYDGTDKTSVIAAAVKCEGTEETRGALTITYQMGETVKDEVKDAGTYDVYAQLAGGSEYEALAKKQIGTVTVKPAVPTVEDLTYTAPENLTFDAAQKTATVTAKSGLNGLGTITVYYEGKDYAKSTTAPVDAGSYKVTADIEAGTNYTAASGIEVSTFTIIPKEIEPTIYIEDEQVFDGSEKTPFIIVKDGDENTGTQLEGKQFTVEYENNVNVGKAVAKVSPVEGGNYTWTAPATYEFNIVQADAPTLSAVNAKYKYTDTTERQVADVTAMLPSNCGSCTVTPAITAEANSIIESVRAEGGVVFAKLKGGEIDQTATIKCTIKTQNYADATLDIIITLTDRDMQEPLAISSAKSMKYGEELTLTTTGGSGEGEVSFAIVEGEDVATINGNALTAKKAGTVKVQATKGGDENYNEITSAIVEITVEKATPTGTVNFPAVSASGKKLSEINPDISKLAPAGGTFAWVLGGDTEIKANQSYEWTYTPKAEDLEKYQVLSGSTVLWRQYTGGPAAPADNVTNQPGSQGTGTTEATAPTTTANMSNSTTVKTESKVDAATGETKNVVTSQTTVDKATAEKIVDKAVANKSEEVIIDTTTRNPARTEAAQVGIPTATLEAISEKTNADVTVKTDVAEVKLDNKTAGEVAEQATGVTVHIVAEKTKEEVTKVEFELKVVDSNGKVIADFNGGNVSVTVKVPVVMKDKKLVCVYIDDNGRVSKVKGQKNNNDTFTFITGHFSAYAIMTEEEADAAIAAQVEELVKGLDDIDLVARSVRTSKGNVKVTLKVDKEGQALIDEIKEAGYTVKYNFYRSTKKRAGYVSKLIKGTKTYTNTYGKKGTNYYYKARVQVYDAEGKLIAKTALKDCKYASRLWKK